MKDNPHKIKIRGRGGDDNEKPHVPVEADDTLQSTAYLRFVDLIAEGEIVGLVDGHKSIYLNETPLQNGDGTYNFHNVDAVGRYGTPTQSYIPGFSAIETEIAIGTEFRFGSGAGGDIVRQITNPNVDRFRVRISIPQLTVTDKENGDIGGSSVSVAVYLQPNGGSFTKVASRTVSGKSSSKFEFTLQAELTGSAPWNIKVVRTTPNAVDSYTQNKTIFESYTEIIDAKLRYPNSAVIGMRIDATQFTSVPSRYYDVKLLKIQLPSNYNPETREYTGTWDGTFQVAWSDNPAWVFWDLVTNERYGLGRLIPESNVDKWSLYEIAKYCDELVPDGFGGMEPRFTCNLLISGREEAYTVLQNLASVFRGMIYWAAGSVTLVQDAPQDPAQLFTAANVVDGRFTYQGASAKATHSVALVSWNDPLDFYRLKVEYVEDQDAVATRGITETEIVALGCTSRGQAHRLGKWLLYTEQNEGETVTFRTGLDGIPSRPGQIIQIADAARAGARMGGRISAATTTEVTIDQDIPDPLTGHTLSVMLPDGSVESRTVAGSTGRIITVTPAYSLAPNAQSVWMLQSIELEPQLWRVIGIKEEEDRTFTVLALRHFSEKFDHVEQDLILEARNYSILTAAPAAPVNPALTETLYQTASEVKTKVAFSWERVLGAAGYLVRYKRDDENFVEIPETSFNEVTLLDAIPGSYVFEVVAVNSLGRKSPVTTLTKEVFGKTAPPVDVSGFSMIPTAELALLTWDQATDLDVLIGGWVKIRHTPRTSGQLWKDAIDVIPAVPGSSTSALAPLMNGTYMIKFVDSSGNYSTNEKIIVTTVPDTTALNVVQTITESPSFPGTRSFLGIDPLTGALTLISGILFDDMASVDDAHNFEYPAGVSSIGEYLFQNTIDLGGSWPFRVRSTIDAEAYDLLNVIDNRIEVMDNWEDIDGTVINDVSAGLLIRTTDDNPALSPTWSPWKRISTGEYTARGIQLKLEATSGSEFHNILIHELEAVIDMADRAINLGAITSGTGASYRVDYAEPFFAAPAIGITATNMNSGDYYVITGASNTGFDITFKNSAGTIVSRIFYVAANGYGRKVA